jgi:hypothetical protein
VSSTTDLQQRLQAAEEEIKVLAAALMDEPSSPWEALWSGLVIGFLVGAGFGYWLG